MKSSRFCVFALSVSVAVFAAGCRSSQPTTAAAEETHSAGHAHTHIRYQCPMHPQFQSDTQTPCAICKMDLVPMEEKKHVHRGMTVTAEQARLMGIALSAVQERELRRSLRVPGHVTNDPYLANLLTEYQTLSAYKNAPAPEGSPPQQQDLQARANAAQTRLLQIGIDARSVVARGNMQIPLNQPDKYAWVNAHIFEEDLALVRSGQAADVVTGAYPGQVFRGQVMAIDAGVSKDTHTFKVRVAVENPNGALKTDMAVHVTLRASLGKRLAVPVSAVLDTGARQIVFIGESDGRYEPRPVRVGQQADGWVEVLSGVRAGESVVTSGNFLLDSESQLRALSE